MADAFLRHVSSLRRILRFGEDESALNHGLDVPGQTSAASALVPGINQGLPQISLNRAGIAHDAGCAGLPDCRAAAKTLLQHGPSETAETLRRAANQGQPQVDVAQHAVNRAGVVVIGCLRKKAFGRAGPIVRQGHPKRLF